MVQQRWRLPNLIVLAMTTVLVACGGDGSSGSNNQAEPSPTLAQGTPTARTSGPTAEPTTPAPTLTATPMTPTPSGATATATTGGSLSPTPTPNVQAQVSGLVVVRRDVNAGVADALSPLPSAEADAVGPGFFHERGFFQ